MTLSNYLQPPLPQRTGDIIQWSNLPGASLGLALAMNIKQALIVAPDMQTAARLTEELQFFCDDTKQPLLHFPDWETLPYDHFSPHQDIISERLATLYKILTLQQGLVVTTISTLMQRLPP